MVLPGVRAMADFERRLREASPARLPPDRTPTRDLSPAEPGLAAPALTRSTGAAESERARPDASVGARGPASPSFLGVRTGAPLGPEAELAAVRAELASTRAEIRALQQGLDAVSSEIVKSLTEISAAQSRLASARSRVVSSRKKTGLLGGLLALGAIAAAPMTGGGSLLALGGNAVGFATLGRVDAQGKEIQEYERQLADANRRAEGLRAQQATLTRQRAELDRRATALEQRDLALGAKIDEALASDPSEAVRRLGAAHREAKGLLAEAKDLLGDYQRLAARAAALGVSAAKLKADLEAQAARAEAYAALVEAEVARLTLTLALAAVSAGSAVGAIDPLAAKALKGAVSATKLFALPEAERAPWLAGHLSAALFPSDAPLAAKIAEGTVKALLGPPSSGAQTIEALLASAAGAALGEAERAWLGEVGELPGAPLLALVEVMVGLSPLEREATRALFKSLAAGVAA